MISREALDRMVESQAVPEADRRESIGVVLVVVASSSKGKDANPLVWTILEKTGKAQTDKTAGQISLPAETRKVGEQEMATVLGALGELTGSDDVVNDLYLNPETFYAQSPILVKGRPVDVAFLVYDGPTVADFKPVDQAETKAYGWMPIQAIHRLNGEVRPLVHDSIGFAVSNNVFFQLAQNRSGLVPLSSFLQPDFSIRDFIAQREQQPDIPLT